MNIFEKSKNIINNTVPQRSKIKQLSQITILTITSLVAGCNSETYSVDSIEGNIGQESNNDINNQEQQNTESDTPVILETNRAKYKCDKPDSNELTVDFFKNYFKQSCEKIQTCINEQEDNCQDLDSCQIQDDTFEICISSKNNDSIIYSTGREFNIMCHTIDEIPNCSLSLGTHIEFSNKYEYTCDSYYDGERSFEYSEEQFMIYASDLNHSETSCDTENKDCVTTAQYVRLNSRLPLEYDVICPDLNAGHCHAKYVTITLEEKANGETTYCLQATINN